MKVLLLYNIDLSWEADEIEDVRQSVSLMLEALRQEGDKVSAEELDDSRLERLLVRYNPLDTIVFNLCEALPGIPGSEHLAAATIARMGFTYTGNPPVLLRLSYDKQQVRRLLTGMGISVPRGALLSPGEATSWSLFPAIVKPSHEHCSLTLTENSVVFDRKALRRQIELVNRELGQPALVEDFIDGREFHLSVWNNNRPELLPPAEMDFSAFPEVRDRLCTYDSKCRPGSAHYENIKTILPADLDQPLYEKLENITLKTWKAFGCRDYARFDLRLRDGEFYMLDINPNNDISPDTSFALAAELRGYSYGLMARRIVSMAAARHPLAGLTKRTATPLHEPLEVTLPVSGRAPGQRMN